jgi:uncharacterized protein YlaI
MSKSKSRIASWLRHKDPRAKPAKVWVCRRCKERIPDDGSAAAGRKILEHLQDTHTQFFQIVMREARVKVSGVEVS